MMLKSWEIFQCFYVSSRSKTTLFIFLLLRAFATALFIEIVLENGCKVSAGSAVEMSAFT